MKPLIKETHFGSINISGHQYDHDVLIRLDGQIKKRKKKLSKEIYGTSHKVSLDEAKYLFDEGSKELIIGNGQQSCLFLSEEAQSFFIDKGCAVKVLATPEAVTAWNNAQGQVIGMFHVTC